MAFLCLVRSITSDSKNSKNSNFVNTHTSYFLCLLWQRMKYWDPGIWAQSCLRNRSQLRRRKCNWKKEERLLWGKTYLITMVFEEIFTLKSYLWCTASNLRLLHQKVQQQKLFSCEIFISYTIIITSFYPIDSPLISFLEKESSLLCRIANLMFF